jgi:nucleotide-binding universal stress UspA family protein
MTVLLGFIPTEVGRAALRAAVAEVEHRATSLLVVNIVRSDAGDDPRRASEADLSWVEELVGPLRMPYEIRQVTSDDPVAEVLTRIAGDEGCELLVTGIRRDRAVAPHLVGSTTRALLLRSPCPVLTV